MKRKIAMILAALVAALGLSVIGATPAQAAGCTVTGIGAMGHGNVGTPNGVQHVWYTRVVEKPDPGCYDANERQLWGFSNATGGDCTYIGMRVRYYPNWPAYTGNYLPNVNFKGIQCFTDEIQVVQSNVPAGMNFRWEWAFNSASGVSFEAIY